jgi:acyl-coenzyme A synthetase/AMP-(fatty) acid ligase
MKNCNIGAVLHKAAAERGDAVALVTGKNGKYQQWTFQEVLAESCRYANALRGQGVERGDRVMLMVRPSKEFICLSFALFQLGAVVILIDPGMGYKNLLRCIGSVQPAVLCISFPLSSEDPLPQFASGSVWASPAVYAARPWNRRAITWTRSSLR